MPATAETFRSFDPVEVVPHFQTPLGSIGQPGGLRELLLPLQVLFHLLEGGPPGEQDLFLGHTVLVGHLFPAIEEHGVRVLEGRPADLAQVPGDPQRLPFADQRAGSLEQLDRCCGHGLVRQLGRHVDGLSVVGLAVLHEARDEVRGPLRNGVEEVIRRLEGVFPAEDGGEHHRQDDDENDGHDRPDTQNFFSVIRHGTILPLSGRSGS